MKTLITLSLAILISAGLTTILLYDHLTGHMPWSTDDPEGVVRAVIHSDVLNQDREIIIRLPRDYDPGQKYPIMYVLDGGNEDGRIASTFEILSNAGYVPRTIVVGIPNMSAENRQRQLVPPFMNTEAEDPDSPPGDGDRFLKFMESEVFPFVETRYPAEERLLSGNSRGGLLVMYSLMYRPEMFQARFCFSTPFWRQGNTMVSHVGEFLSSKDSLRSIVYMSAGSGETENIKNGLAEMTKVFSDVAPPGIVWSAVYTENAVHEDNARISIAAALRKWSEYMGQK